MEVKKCFSYLESHFLPLLIEYTKLGYYAGCIVTEYIAYITIFTD